MMKSILKSATSFFVLTALITVSVATADEPSADEPSAGEPSAGAQKNDDKLIVMELKTLMLTVPATWQESDVQSSMRLTTLDLPAASSDGEKAELAVFHFRGGGGGLKANIVRWKGQFSGDGKESKLVKGKAGDEEYHLLELSGTYNKSVGPPVMGKTQPMKDYRMLGAIVPVGDQVYYLKLTGPKAAVKAAAKDFRKSFGGKMESEKKTEL